VIELEKARARLKAKQKELEEISSLSAESRNPVALDQQSVGRLSRMDAMQQQAMSKATEQKRQVNLVRVEAALRRVRDDEYGYCQKIGRASCRERV